ncbi:murein L,D-transpeptidase catalytic domain family protein [Bacteriovorax sp. PP10]|uniref:Murein L,D-transpeptidase catalytic domain family protein n=1 Tax=Bacteriovorax antarcticus TaxID=3088717 RepID=A0ABU5VX80_9BACT|nr:murein L,D-transpeptidase catalytic domain family protein [Bacteriovorax sp. PP10]MEA9357667.1 murein L,D-transpeptidase catalytic domain family protein [Bacteriovorax sp. PP10]
MRPKYTLRLTSVFIALCFLFISNTVFASGAQRPVVDDGSTSDSVSLRPPEAPSGDSGGSSETIEEKYSHVDHDKIVPAALLSKTLAYYDANQSKIKNKNYIIVIDFKQHNSKKRFYLINMNTGDVEQYLTAHGKNSDPDFDGYATKFSNTDGSLMSSVGFYLTAETYYGDNGYSLRLDGLSSTNSNARSRAIVIHGASYVRDASLIGRSYGCPALEEQYAADVIDTVKGGSLIYADG